LAAGYNWHIKKHHSRHRRYKDQVNNNKANNISGIIIEFFLFLVTHYLSQ